MIKSINEHNNILYKFYRYDVRFMREDVVILLPFKKKYIYGMKKNMPNKEQQLYSYHIKIALLHIILSFFVKINHDLIMDAYHKTKFS